MVGSVSINALSFSPQTALHSFNVHTIKLKHPYSPSIVPRLPSIRIRRCSTSISAHDSRLLPRPTSTLQTPSLIPHRPHHFAETVTSIAVKLFLGSLVFLGFSRAGPAIALPAQGSVTVEEKRDTVTVKSEDEQMFEKLLEQDPKNMDALKWIVNAKMKKGETREALPYVERLIDIEPKEVEWKLLRALCYEITGQLSKAERLFNEILKKRPLMLKALHGLAMVMHKKGEDRAIFERLDKALKLARRVKRVTEERNIRILIAQMHVVKGNLDEAMKRLQDLITENPRDFRPYLCQGIVYSLQDKKKEAEEVFETYRSLVPEEFPQRGFLDDVVLAAKTQSSTQLAKEMKAGSSY